jgi:hypothetical protein
MSCFAFESLKQPLGGKKGAAVEPTLVMRVDF